MESNPYEQIWLSAQAEGQQRVEQQLHSAANETVIEIPMVQLEDFPSGPYNRYKIYGGDKREELRESIRHHGILVPLIVRPLESGGYQIIAGKNRRSVAAELGYTTVPCIIRELNDDDALMQLNITNLQHRQLLPSEKAYAYRLEVEVLNRQGLKSSTCGQLGHKSRNLISSKESGRQIQRLIRLTYLTEDILLDAVDEKLLSVGASESISFLSSREQRLVAQYFFERKDGVVKRRCNRSLSINGAHTLRDLHNSGSSIDEITLDSLREQTSTRYRRLQLNMTELRQKWPELVGMTEKEVATLIEDALATYFNAEK